MSDWQQPPESYPPPVPGPAPEPPAGPTPPPPMPPQAPGYAPMPPQPPAPVPPQAPGYAPMPPQGMPPGPPMQPAPPAKRNTKTIVIVVVVVVLLLLCCCVAGFGYLFYTASRTASNITSLAEQAAKTDPKEVARLAEWDAAKSQFATTGYKTVAPTSRQTGLADAATTLLFPDFTIDELHIQPGTYDQKTKYYTFDSYVVLMHLTSDPAVKLARSYSVTQPAADSLKRGDITLNPNRAVERLKGTSWIIYATDKVPPLLKGIKDQKYVALMKKIAADWDGGVFVSLVPATDGTVDTHIFTWDSYWQSPADDYIDAVYSESGGTWTLKSYKLVIQGQDVPSADTTPGA